MLTAGCIPLAPYPSGETLDPEIVRDKLFGAVYVPLVRVALGDPPPGQIRLVEPVGLSADPEVARAQQREMDWLRDWRARLEQESQFAFFTCKLLWQRGFDTLTAPNYSVWSDRFSNRELIEQAENLHEAHGDVRLRIGMENGDFELCGLNTRVRQSSDDVNVSLLPVVHALSMQGLWPDRSDEQFRDLARVMARLATDKCRRVGRTEFVRLYGQSEQ